MNTYLTNTTKFSITAKVNSIEYLLEPNQVQSMSVYDNDKIVLSIVNKTNKKSYSEKFINSLNSLVLNVSCTYLIKNLTENENIQIANEIYEFDENALLLPFAYHYLKPSINNTNTQLQLVQCEADNVKTIKRIYFIFALLGDGGFDFLLNIFSITFQMHRIKKLCDDNKILQIISNTENNFLCLQND